MGNKTRLRKGRTYRSEEEFYINKSVRDSEFEKRKMSKQEKANYNKALKEGMIAFNFMLVIVILLALAAITIF